MKASGIYKIYSKINSNKLYIGSSIDLEYRWLKHLSELKLNRHHSRKLQFHYNKYGEDDLVFVIIEPCLPVFLVIREQYYIDKLKPFFNCNPKAGSPLGIKRTEEQKRKRSESQKGRPGKIPSKESRIKMSIAHKNNPSNTQFKKGNKSHTEGKTLPVEVRTKISKSLLGKCYNTFPEEHRKRLSDGAKKMWQRRSYRENRVS